MKEAQKVIWYAGYGSNLSEQRFNCYIIPGIPKYGEIPAKYEYLIEWWKEEYKK